MYAAKLPNATQILFQYAETIRDHLDNSRTLYLRILFHTTLFFLIFMTSNGLSYKINNIPFMSKLVRVNKNMCLDNVLIICI